jgi:hypothetical protein
MGIAFLAVFRKYLTGMIPLAILEHSNLDPLLRVDVFEEHQAFQG